MGSSGLEPPTSRLSGVRSNHLSYEPSFGGDERVRTDDPLLAKQVLSQLSYTPILCCRDLLFPEPQKLNNDAAHSLELRQMLFGKFLFLCTLTIEAATAYFICPFSLERR